MFAVLCARAETKTIGAYTWTYRVVNGAAEIFNDNGYGGTTAVSPSPSGKVAIPATLGAWTVRSIGNNALRSCNNMTEVYIPECVTNIAPFAFYHCDNLESADVCSSSKRVTIIGDSAFSLCVKLNALKLPEYLHSIGSYAFAYTAIESITLPAGVTSIGNQAFAACDNLNYVRYLGNRPTADNIYANTPDDAESIVTEGTTGWDDALEAGTWQGRAIRAVLPTETDAHGYTWTYRIVGDAAQIFNNDAVAVDPAPNGSLAIPATLGGKPVTSIGAHALEGCDALLHASIPGSVTNIEEFAFAETPIGKVTIPDGVKAIGEKAFFGCDQLKTATLPKNLKVIGLSAFESCAALTDMTIPDGVTTIGESAFYFCSSLKELTIPASVTTIGDAAFACCDRLRTVTYLGNCPKTGEAIYGDTPEDLESAVPADATGWDEAVESGTWQDRGVRVVLPQWTDGGGYTWTYRIIDGEAEIYDWGRCAVDPEPTGAVTVPSTLGGKPVTKIGESAFAYCKGMTSVNIPASVKTIGDGAFFNCTGLADKNGFVIVRNVLYGYFGAAVDVAVPAGVTRIAGRAFNMRSAMMGNPSLVSVTLPASVTSIGTAAFYGCTELKSVTRLDEISDIGDAAFFYCFAMADEDGFVIVHNVLHGYYGKATDLTVPDGVTRISALAFMNELGCALENVTIPRSVKEIGPSAFDLCDKLKTVTYLCDCPTVGENIYLKAAPGLESRVSPYVAGWGDVLKAGVWQERPIRVDNSIPEPPPIAPLVYTVTFNANGGTLASGSVKRSVESGKAVGALPAATRSGYTLDGWFTKASGGAKVTAATKVAAAVTYYAQWTKNGGGETPTPGPTPDPEVVPYLYETVAGAAPALASVYDGYLYNKESGALAGTIQVKVGKPNARTGLASVKATVVGPDGKKKSLKAEEKGKAAISSAGPTTVSLAGGDPCKVVLGLDALAGTYGAYAIDGARNFFSSKDKSEANAANDVIAQWIGAVNVVWDGGVASVSIAKKGKVKASVTLANGTKATANSRLLVGESWLCVPVVVAKKANIAFTLWLPRGGGEVVVEGLPDGAVAGKAGALKSGAAFKFDAAALASALGDATYAAQLPDGLSVEQDGKKWIVAGGAKAGKVQLAKGAASPADIDVAKAGANPSALKLAYKVKDGTFKGTFKAYTLVKGKPKATTVNVSGILVGDKGYGTLSVKKTSVSAPVEIR